MKLFTNKTDTKSVAVNIMGLSFNSPLGIDVSENMVSPSALKFLLKRGFSFAVVRTQFLSGTIAAMKDFPREANVFVRLNKSGDYLFEHKHKSFESAYAILYDFVDAFIISGFTDLAADLDPLLNLRLYNDEYRPILLQLPPDSTKDDVDRILNYAMMNGIEGLCISDHSLLEYATSKASGRVKFISTNVQNAKETSDALNSGASLATITKKSHQGLLGTLCLARKINSSLL